MCLDPRVGIQRQRRLIMPPGQADVTRPSRPWRAERERERGGDYGENGTGDDIDYDDDAAADDGDGQEDNPHCKQQHLPLRETTYCWSVIEPRKARAPGVDDVRLHKLALDSPPKTHGEHVGL